MQTSRLKHTLLTLGLLVSLPLTAAEEVNLYSARKEALIKPLLDAFSSTTNIHVNLITSKADALLKRIETEGKNSPADVLLTTDAGRLHRAKQAGVFKPLESTVLQINIPSQYRDKDQTWFGLSVRLRPIMVTDKIDRTQLTSYEDLAKPEYTKQICVRSSSNIYNQSLVASMLEANGKEQTETWAADLVNNMARKPQGGDRDQIRGAAVGQCNIVIANTYYLAQMLSNQQNTTDYEAAQKLHIIWPNQNDRGAHANISGAGLLANAPNPDNGIKLIEFLSSEEAQAIYANINYEYPVKQGIDVNPILSQWGKFKADTINLSVLGDNNSEAVMLMDRAGWQ